MCKTCPREQPNLQQKYFFATKKGVVNLDCNAECIKRRRNIESKWNHLLILNDFSFWFSLHFCHYFLQIKIFNNNTKCTHSRHDFEESQANLNSNDYKLKICQLQFILYSDVLSLNASDFKFFLSSSFMLNTFIIFSFSNDIKFDYLSLICTDFNF